jgi:hypothetical protein
MIPRITSHSSNAGEYIRVPACNLLPEEVGEMMRQLEDAKARCQILGHERMRQFPERGVGWHNSATTG